MNNSVGEAVFTIKLNADQAKQALNDWQSKLDSSMADSEKSTKSLSNGFDDLASSIASLATAGVAFAGLTSAIGNVTDAYNSYQAAMNGIRAVARATGNDVTESMSAIKEVTANGLVSQEDAAAAMKNLQLYGYSVQEATQMIKTMTDAAVYNRQANYSTVSEAVRVTTEGIRMENSVLSDASGVTKNIAKMHEEYAKQLGTTTDKLTDAQKAQAVYNGYMQEGGIFFGNAEEYTKTLAGAQQQLSTAVTQVKQVLGSMFDSFAPIISGIATWVSENQTLVAWLATTIGLIAGGSGLVAAIRVGIKAVSAISKAMTTLGIVSSVAKAGILGLVTIIAAVGAAALVSNGIDSMNSSLEDTNEAAGSAAKSLDEVGTVSEKTAKKIADLNKQIAKLDRDYTRDLKSIAVSHEENLAKLTEQIEEANADYRRAIDERVADFNVSLAKEERTHQEMVDELMTQLNFLQRYNNDYNKQKLAQVQFALAKEEALYQQQTEKEREQLEMQNAADKEKLEKKLASLQQELADEEAFMNKHREALNSVRDIILLDEIESLNERYEEQKRSYQEQIAEARLSGDQIGSTLGANINESLQEELSKLNLSSQGKNLGKQLINGMFEGIEETFVGKKGSFDGIFGGIAERFNNFFNGNGFVSGTFDYVNGKWVKRTTYSNGGSGWAEGGYTGRGNPDEVAGVVHKGEYVIPADQVNQNTGLPKAGGTTVQNFNFDLSGVVAGSAQAMRELAAKIQQAIQQTNQSRFMSNNNQVRYQ